MDMHQNLNTNLRFFYGLKINPVARNDCCRYVLKAILLKRNIYIYMY